MQRFPSRSTRLPSMVWGVALALLAIAHTDQAFAFCRTTTCDETEEVCLTDEDLCPISGQAVYWPDLCVSFGVHAAGSTLRGISAEKAATALKNAFQTWISADCGDGRHPSLGAFSRGEVFCDEVEYNYDSVDQAGERHVAGPNANIMVFRDDGWEYIGTTQTLAVTTITFATSTGQILDADIELNSFATEFTTGEEFVRTDLQAVLTHEVGHFLGLAHSLAAGATMNKDYDSGNLDFRSLSDDDRRAICAVYPPLEPTTPAGVGGGSTEETDAIDCRGEQPRFGFSRYCGEPVLADGCSVRAVNGTNGAFGALTATFALAWLSVRRRRAASRSAS
jgi:hypothetical protein